MRPGWGYLIGIFAITAGVFLSIDFLWLGLVAKGFYARHLGNIMRDQVNWIAAAAFYGIYIGGILVFVIIPAIHTGAGILHTALMGGLLGLFAYSAFDLTALALVSGWPVAVTVVDILWGTLLTAATASSSLIIVRAMILRGQVTTQLR